MKNPKIKSVLLRSLEEAGSHLKRSLLLKKAIGKKSELDLVTQVDKACEKKILKIIRQAFPEHSILAEESAPISGSSSRWIIDPLDGTVNFAHSYPTSSVSIAYEENGKILMGGVYDPFRGELYFAERGKGAVMNGRKIKVSATKKLSESLVCTGFPYDRRTKIDKYLAVFKSFIMKVQDLRRVGSAALDLCYVACGRFDGYWEFKLQPWDKAAGMLILEEAGGKITNFSGAKLNLEHNQNLASNGHVHAEMLEVVKPFRDFNP